LKTAIVTGGATGIGAATVRALCKQGYSVAIVYNSSEENALALSSGLIYDGFDAFPVKADVRNPDEVNEAVNRVFRLNRRIDVLVNNAGLSLSKLTQDVTDAEWASVLGVNLSGAFYFCRAVLPHMIRAQAGRIVNIASMWGQAGASMEVAYSAAKAGVIGLTKALAKETALSGVTVNCVAPGAVDTAMMASFSEADVQALCEEIPVGRLGTPEEVAGAVAFFTAEENGYITGQVLGVNGGFVV
jgi:3-oxoacyl-[acyl-carrier protein] reductase